MQYAVWWYGVALSFVVATATPRALRSQAAACQPSIGGVTSACALPDWEGVLSQPLPRYPQILWEAEVEGHVDIRVIVDTTGAPSAKSVKVVASSHELFTRAVREVLPTWRFAVARKDGVPLDVAYETRVHFAIDAGMFPRVAISSDLRPVTPSPRSSLRISDSVVVQQLGWEVVRQLIEREPPQPAGLVFCTALTERDTVMAGAQRVVAMHNCPRTYASMGVRVPRRPEDAAPPGHVDPVEYSIGNLVLWGSDFLNVEVSRRRQLGGVILRCAARRVDTRWQDVQCRRWAFFAH